MAAYRGPFHYCLLAAFVLSACALPAVAQVPWVADPVPVLEVGPTGSWDGELVQPNVLFDGSEYKMWYIGITNPATHPFLLGLATSPDGLNWTKYPGNPIMGTAEPSGWSYPAVFHPSVLWDGQKYRMWYEGYTEDGYKIGYAESSDGINWNKHPANPVFEHGDPGTWDEASTEAPFVILEGTTYRMWYRGKNASGAEGIGYALSLDGINWSRSPAPVLRPGTPPSYDDREIEGVFVFRGPNGSYQMLYTAYSSAFPNQYTIQLATSVDGVDWVKSDANPLPQPGPSTYPNAYSPWVLREGNVYRMWYACGNYATGDRMRICHATFPAPDDTPPFVVPSVTGTLGASGWYTSDVTVAWSVSDPESEVTSTNGCGSVTVTEDTAGTTFTCSATSAGGTASESVTIKRDTTAPTVTCSATPIVLWPANHKLWDVTATATTSDTSASTLKGLEILSSEADSGLGDGDLPNDIQGFSSEMNTRGLLRAERYGKAGRTYTFNFTVADDAGNTGMCAAYVNVPHDQGNGKKK